MQLWGNPQLPTSPWRVKIWTTNLAPLLLMIQTPPKKYLPLKANETWIHKAQRTMKMKKPFLMGTWALIVAIKTSFSAEGEGKSAHLPVLSWKRIDCLHLTCCLTVCLQGSSFLHWGAGCNPPWSPRELVSIYAIFFTPASSNYKTRLPTGL